MKICFRHTLTVFSYQQNNEVVLKVNELAKKQIHMLLFDKVFCLITSLKEFFVRKNAWHCPVCERMSCSKFKHVCARAVCQFCKCVSQCKGEILRCGDCLRTFAGKECFDRHRLEGVSEIYKNVCRQVMACPICKTDLKAKDGQYVEIDGFRKDAYKKGKAGQHTCYGVKCVTCDMTYDQRIGKHQCYVAPLKGAKLAHLEDLMLSTQNWYLDIETAVHTDEAGIDVFKTNCVVMQSAELVPMDDSEEFEHPTEYFLGENALDKLAQFLFFSEDSLLASRKYHNIWAHNGGRFDWYPILGKYLQNGMTPTNVIISGNTIKEFRVGNAFFRYKNVYSHSSKSVKRLVTTMSSTLIYTFLQSN